MIGAFWTALRLGPRTQRNAQGRETLRLRAVGLTLLLVAGNAVAAGPAPTAGHAVAASNQASLELKIQDPAGGALSSSALRIVVMLTALAIVPTILLMMTSFVRMAVALHFLRQALGTPTLPPNQVVLGLALFLTFFVMSPTLDRINQEAWQPFDQGKVDAAAGVKAATVPLRDFMLKNVREKDLALFAKLARIERPKQAADLPLRVVVPAFMVSELRTGFEIGFLLFLPFLVIDLVVSSVLLSMGMMMLPPTTVSLPFKVLLFVLVDGWSLLAGSLVAGFR